MSHDPSLADVCRATVVPRRFSALAKSPPNSAVAICLVGVMRSFVVESVHRSIKANLIDSVAEPGRSDVFIFAAHTNMDDRNLAALDGCRTKRATVTPALV